MKILLITWLIPFLLNPIPEFKTANLLVHIENADSDEGKVLVLIFNTEEGFPENVDKAFKQFTLAPKDQKVELELEDLPPGKYAISVLHDEDSNGAMTTNRLGLPEEKYGFSNNPKIYFGPPSFEKAAVQLGSENRTIRINLR